MLLPVRKLVYRRGSLSWRDVPDKALNSIQRSMRRRWDVLDALPLPDSKVFLMHIVVDSTASKKRVAEAGAQFVNLALAHGFDLPCVIVVVDAQVREIAHGGYLPGEQEISWWFTGQERR